MYRSAFGPEPRRITEALSARGAEGAPVTSAGSRAAPGSRAPPSGEELALAAGTRPSASAHVEARTRSRGRSVDTGSPTLGRRRPRACPSEQRLVAQRASVNGVAGWQGKGARPRRAAWAVLPRR